MKLTELLEKFFNEHVEVPQMLRKEVDAWIFSNLETNSSSAYFHFVHMIEAFMCVDGTRVNKIYSFDWGAIKEFYKSDSKKFEVLHKKFLAAYEKKGGK